MKSDAKTVNEIIEMLKRYANAYTDKNLDAMMELFLDSPDIVAIGTGKDEWVKGYHGLKEGFRRDITQSENIKVNFENINVSSAGSAAWASMNMIMNAKIENKEIILEGRLSVVFEKLNEKWYFAHLHYSLPSENQEEGYSFPD
ncbi:MAG: AtzH-like domain-containing protein [Methanobacterium sp.]